MQKGFIYILCSHTDFFPKVLIFLVIYTDFVLNQSGKSAYAILRSQLLMRMRLKKKLFLFSSKYLIIILEVRQHFDVEINYN